MMNEALKFATKRDQSQILAACLLVVLFVLTALFAYRIRSVEVASSHTADLRLELPEKVGDWIGEDIYYCQREQCAKSFLAGELKGSTVCPVCEGKVDLVSLGERTILPADTTIVRRMYQNAKRENITVTIVLSGKEQRSIHRPQQCLPAQGFAIEQSAQLNVPLNHRPPLTLTLIRARKAGVGQATHSQLLMAYWFAGGGHETHDHIERMMYMAWDNLIKGIRPRWAYVSLQTSVTMGEKAAEKRLIEFVQQLYPLLKPGK